MKYRMLLAAVAVFVLGVVVSFAWAEDKSTTSPEGRYRLHNGINRSDNLILRIDTQTGDTWVLNTSNRTWETVR